MNQLKKNFLYNSLLSLSSILTPLISFPYVARVIEPEGIGMVSFTNTLIQYFIFFTALGMPLYGIREAAKTRDSIAERTTILVELTLFRVVSAAIIIVPYLVVVLSFERLRVNSIFYYWGILSIVLGIVDVNWFFAGLEKFKFTALRTIFFQVIQTVAFLTLIRSKSDSLIYFLIPIFITLINAAVNLYYLRPFIDLKQRSRNISLRKHVKPMFILFATMFAASLYSLLDTLILGFLTNDHFVGYYSLATRLYKIPLTVLMALAPVILPRISYAVANEDKESVRHLVSTSLNFTLILGVPFTFGLFLMAPELSVVLGGSKFLPAVNTLKILAPLTLIIAITNNFSSQLLVPFHKDKLLFRAVTMGTVVSITLNFLLIPFFYQNGAAITILITELVVLVACYRYSRDLVAIELPFKNLLVQIAVSIPYILFAYISRMWFTHPIPVLACTFGISGLYFFIIQCFIIKNPLVYNFYNQCRVKLGWKTLN